MKKNPTYTHLFRPIRLLIFSKKSHLYVYSLLYFYQFLYIHGPILLPFKTFLWPILTSDDLRSHFETTIGNLNQKLINCKRIFYWNSKQTLLYPIECYQKIPPILLFRPIRLLDAVGSSGILKGKQKLGVTINSDKLGGIDLTKFSKLSMCSAGAGRY